MLNKQKMIKVLIFSVVIFTLIVNLTYLSHEKIYENGDYAVYNNEVLNYSESAYSNVSLEVKQQAICSDLKSPFGNLRVYYGLISLAVLMMAVSMIVILLMLILKRYRKIELSYKNIFVIIGIELASLLIFAWAFILESDYYFTYCWRIF